MGEGEAEMTQMPVRSRGWRNMTIKDKAIDDPGRPCQVLRREQLDSSGGRVEDWSELRFAVRVRHDAKRHPRKDCQYQGGVTDVPFDSPLVPDLHRLSPSQVFADRGGPNDAVVFEADRIYPSPDRGELAVTAFGDMGVTGFLILRRTVR
jgi:hypothetical protein